MQTAPVRYRRVRPEFERLSVRRIEPVLGAIADVLIAPNFDVHIQVDGATHLFTLDPREAEDLLHALTASVDALSERQLGPRPMATPEPGPRYDVEIGWAGRTYRVHNASPGADDALHAIVHATDSLLGQARHEIALRRQPPLHDAIRRFSSIDSTTNDVRRIS